MRINVHQVAACSTKRLPSQYPAACPVMGLSVQSTDYTAHPTCNPSLRSRLSVAALPSTEQLSLPKLCLPQNKASLHSLLGFDTALLMG